MKKFLLTVILLISTLLGLSYSGMLPLEFLGMEVSQTDEESSEALPPTSNDAYYLPIDPSFMVNFTHLGILRYLQISVEISYPTEDMIDRAVKHMPAIRNSLILLLSDQPYEKLSTLTGKEELRSEMAAVVNEIVYRDSTVNFPGEIFITNFVMQ